MAHLTIDEYLAIVDVLIAKHTASIAMRCFLHAGHAGRHLFAESNATPILGECEARRG